MRAQSVDRPVADASGGRVEGGEARVADSRPGHHEGGGECTNCG
jgi:hypothetical protein